MYTIKYSYRLTFITVCRVLVNVNSGEELQVPVSALKLYRSRSIQYIC